MKALRKIFVLFFCILAETSFSFAQTKALAFDSNLIKVNRLSSGSSSTTDLGREINRTIADTLFEIIGTLTVAGFEATSIGFTFAPYPYCSEQCNFIMPDETGASTKFFISDAVVFNTLFGLGNMTRFDGYFWRWFGPVFENQMYWNLSNGEETDSAAPKGIVYLGAQMTLLKFDYFIDQIIFQYGIDYGLYNHGNFKISYAVKCYPGAHFEIEDRISAIGFEKWWGENELHIGVQAGRAQVYAVWNFSFATDKTHNYFHQLGGGVKIYM